MIRRIKPHLIDRLVLFVFIASGLLAIHYYGDNLFQEERKVLQKRFYEEDQRVLEKTLEQDRFFSRFIFHELIHLDSLVSFYKQLNQGAGMIRDPKCHLVSTIEDFKAYGIEHVAIHYEDGKVLSCDGKGNLVLKNVDVVSKGKGTLSFKEGFVTRKGFTGYSYDYPIKNGKDRLGYVEIGVRLQTLLRRLSEVKEVEYGFIGKKEDIAPFRQKPDKVFVGRGAYYIIPPFTDERRDHSDEKDFNDFVVSLLRGKKGSDKTVNGNHNREDVDYYVSLLPLKSMKDSMVYLISYRRDKEIHSIKKDYLIYSLLISAGFISFALFLYYFYHSRRILTLTNKILKEEVDNVKNELRKNYYMDKMTDFPNRFQLIEDIVKYPDPKLAVFDIDRFNEINALFGFVIGDYILIELGNRLKEFSDKSGFFLYKLPGDEYALLADSISMKDFIKKCETMLVNIENKGIYFEKNEIITRISLGMARGKENILSKADMALKKAKAEKKHMVVYENSMRLEGQIESNLKWAGVLSAALMDNGILPYFQPIYDCHKNRIEKFEALVRLEDETGNIVPPFYFLRIAKRTRVYTKLLRIMLYKSLKAFEGSSLSFSINLSVDDIINPLTVSFIKNHLEKFDMGNQIVFEITESDGIENFQEVSDFISDFKKMGVRVAVDDFGTGYSNFEYLLKMDIDYIKIDGSLIKHIDVDDNSKLVVENIVQFANKRNLQTIGEYVHNETVFREAKKMGIDFLQGYYIGRPRREVVTRPDF